MNARDDLADSATVFLALRQGEFENIIGCMSLKSARECLARSTTPHLLRIVR